MDSFFSFILEFFDLYARDFFAFMLEISPCFKADFTMVMVVISTACALLLCIFSMSCSRYASILVLTVNADFLITSFACPHNVMDSTPYTCNSEIACWYPC